MKTIVYSLLLSAILHAMYFAGTILIGFIQTVTYQPDVIETHSENMTVLQDEIAFGYSGSPFFFLPTFLAVALVSGIILKLYRKPSKTR